MKQLELKHLAPYLPYGLTTKLRTSNEYPYYTIVGLTTKGILKIGDNGHHMWETKFEDCIPILRPLSDLTKDENFELYLDLCEELEMVRCDSLLQSLTKGDYYAIDIQKYHILEKWMCKNHFDWKFGLIENGLAIDINTLTD